PAPTPTTPPVPSPPSVVSGTPESFLLVRSTPPSGMTLLSFSINVAQAALGPSEIPLMPNPVRVELYSAQVESSLLAAVHIAPGLYSNLTISFSDASLTLLTSSGTPKANCDVGAICNFAPTLSST